MKFYLILFTLVCVRAQIKHQTIELTACSDTEKEYMIGSDGEVEVYSDFVRQRAVTKLPPFADPFEYPGIYETSVADMEICKQNLQVLIKDYKDQPIAEDAPQTSIYPRNNVIVGSQNTLICHSERFFPPPIKVTWTKNDVDITDSARLSQNYPNKGGTYNQFSYLDFTPEEGDVYSCAVEHQALQMPETKRWDVDVERPSVGATVFCAVGLTVGLIGVAIGILFIILAKL
ncbi:H-2 class II histocompatibility antigen, I-E alpha chain-like [Trichomycterus rosablanca]|uniref:H-2 class II histocompatibility antigen, I-E alpha chain-like n=1 Tax=Trichomycterus rosablanca TaxID=2290929 RepID=UPI002F3548C3